MIWQSDNMNEIKDAEEENIQINLKKSFKFFSINKKIIWSIMLIGFISLATGIGTYSWFTTSASSGASTAVVGTFELGSDNEGACSTAIFNMNNVQPGVIPDNFNTICFTNKGSLDMIMKVEQFTLDIKDEKNPQRIGAADSYRFIAYFYKNDEKSEPIYRPETYVDKNGKEKDKPETVEYIKAKLNEKLDTGNEKHIVFTNGEKLICKFKLVLPEDKAKNENQGDTVTGAFKIAARQNVDDSSYTE